MMAWCRIYDKPLCEPMLTDSLTHICGTRGRLVKRQTHNKRQHVTRLRLWTFLRNKSGLINTHWITHIMIIREWGYMWVEIEEVKMYAITFWQALHDIYYRYTREVPNKLCYHYGTLFFLSETIRIYGLAIFFFIKPLYSILICIIHLVFTLLRSAMMGSLCVSLVQVFASSLE